MSNQTENTTTPNDEVNKKDFVNKHLPQAIMLAVELESAFKLYSYRILTPEQFIARTNELVRTSKTSK